MRQAHENACRRVGQRGRGEAGVLDGFPRRFQQQSVLRIERDGRVLVDAEELVVEAGDVVEKRTPFRVRPARHAGLRVVILVGIPALAWHFGDEILAALQRLPQPFGGVDAVGQSTRHADDSDRGDGVLAHRRRGVRRIGHFARSSTAPNEAISSPHNSDCAVRCGFTLGSGPRASLN
jgi:hypothetical protein